MPLGRFRKKKKKNLPEPPSFSKNDKTPFLEPSRDTISTKPPKTSVLQAPPRIETPHPPRASSELPGSPREPSVFKGPPRQSQPKNLPGPSNLPSPPPFSEKTPSQPPLSSGPPTQAPVPLFSDETTSEDILAELRQKKFGSGMKKVPERKAVSLSTNDLARRHFQDTKKNYIEAGKKLLELNFYDNVATNYACAILCDLIGEGWQAARRTMTDLSTGIPSAVMNNTIFDSVRAIIEAIRTKNFTFLTRAEKTIKSNTGRLYPEDIAIIEKALKAARAYFGYV